MNCEQVQSLLVCYLHHETTPSERALIRAHLSGCPACEKEMTRLAVVQNQISSVLQRRAAQAVPSPEAWSKLEARLAQVAQPAPANFGTWLSRLAPGVSQFTTQLFSGGVTMRKRLLFTTLATVVIAIAAAVFMTRTATPVSAKEILQHAYTAQATENPTQGIDHIRSEFYSNAEALPGGEGWKTIVESYHDLASGSFRVVTIDSQSGKVALVMAQDGSNIYTSQDDKVTPPGNGPLLIYRSPQNGANLGIQKRFQSSDRLELKATFDRIYNSPDVEFVGQETWETGQTVYALRSYQEVKAMENAQITHPMGFVTTYFDVATYAMLGSQVTFEKDGQEVLLSSQRILADEILPAETHVAWDLSDLPGVKIVDDTSEASNLPKVTTLEELMANAPALYLLKTVPDGYSLELKSIPNRSVDAPYFYSATYSKEADYFMVRVWGDPIKDPYWAEETYTTAGGLVFYLISDEDITPEGGKVYSAQVDTPSGLTLAIISTFPLETFKAWAEEIVLVN